MSIVNRLALTALIVSFSGSVVVVAARNLKDKLGKYDEKDVARAQQLIHALHGDPLFQWQAKYGGQQGMPARSGGGILPDHDKQRIKGFLASLIGSHEPAEPGKKDESEASSDAEGEK